MNYDFVFSACSHYWNTSLTLSKEPMERILLRDALTDLLGMTAPLVVLNCNKGKGVCMYCNLELLWLHQSDGKVDLSPNQKGLLLSLGGAIFQAYIDKVRVSKSL